LAFLPGLVDECADEAGTDAAALMIGVDFDTGEVDLGRAVFDVEHADVCPAGHRNPCSERDQGYLSALHWAEAVVGRT